jgi:transcriptional regulator with XRE-family HTH domain
MTTTTAGRKPDPADVHVGQRIAALRTARGMSQSDLAKLAGPLTFQQFQKYEAGANRVSASRLLQVAVALGVPVAYFFEGLPGAAGPDANGVDTYGVPSATLTTKHGWAMARAYEAANPELRKVMSAVVVMLGDRLVEGITLSSSPRTVAEQAAIAAASPPDRRHAGAH